jgi:hypothetical protein
MQALQQPQQQQQQQQECFCEDVVLAACVGTTGVLQVVKFTEHGPAQQPQQQLCAVLIEPA